MHITNKHNNCVSRVGTILMGLFLFIVMIDPTNTILHKKDIMFLLVVAYNVFAYKPKISNLPYIIIMFCAVAIPWVLSLMRMIPNDETEVLAAFKSISPVILFLWADRYDVIKIARLPVIVCCILCIIFYGIV